MAAQTRFFVVDDRSSAIQYSGSWNSIDGNDYNGAGSFGPTYQNTLRRTTSTGSSLSFTFTGDAARIMGTHDVRSPSTAPDPAWRCYLDGQEVARERPATTRQNAQAFCKFYELPPGRHTVRVDVTSNGQPFLFDMIQYRPTVSTDGVGFVSRFDPDMRYSDAGWQRLGDVARMATVGGSYIDYWFIGTRVTWIGMYPHQLPRDDAPATYSIDNGPAVPFTIRGGGGSSDFNRQIFQTPSLSHGRHHLRVTYQGRTNLTPLVLINLLVDGASTQILGVPSSSTGGGSSSGNGGSGSGGETGGNGGGGASGPITVTMPVDVLNNDVPNADRHSDLISGTLEVHSTAHTSEGSHTVYTIDPNALNANAGNPNDQGTASGSGPKNDQKPDGFPIAGIVGIVLGFLLILALIGMFLFWRRAKRRRHLRLADGHENVQPFSSTTSHNGNASQRTSMAQTVDSYGVSGPAMQPADGYSATSAISQRLAPNRYTSNSDTTSDFSNSSSNLLQPVRKDRGAFENPMSAASPSSSTGNSTLAQGSGSSASGSARLVVHEDSGLRMPRPQSLVEDIPPQYTPG